LRVRIAPICNDLDAAAAGRAPSADPPRRSRIDELADAALAAFLERLFERSAVALVRAVI
jgi:hypothetical protein